MEKDNSGKNYSEVIKKIKLAPLSLDKKYHDLKNKVGSNEAIDSLEAELNELIKEQGKLTCEIKDIKKLKKKLMQEIVDSSNEDSLNNASNQKKKEDNTRLISDCNEKIDEKEDLLLDFPKKIDEINARLMEELMNNCYCLLKENEADIEEISKWITKVRIDLKKKLVKKTDMEVQNNEIYSFMHDIFGAEVIELFDMKYKDNSIK